MMLALLLLLIWTPTVEAETPVWDLVKNARLQEENVVIRVRAGAAAVWQGSTAHAKCPP